jgi:hypothetical protein
MIGGLPYDPHGKIREKAECRTQQGLGKDGISRHIKYAQGARISRRHEALVLCQAALNLVFQESHRKERKGRKEIQNRSEKG